jgi:hypothetical protein
LQAFGVCLLACLLSKCGRGSFICCSLGNTLRGYKDQPAIVLARGVGEVVLRLGCLTTVRSAQSALAVHGKALLRLRALTEEVFTCVGSAANRLAVSSLGRCSLCTRAASWGTSTLCLSLLHALWSSVWCVLLTRLRDWLVGSVWEKW